MKGKFVLGITLASTLWLPANHAFAQVSRDHYLAGTEGIKAGSLPDPGLYFDDINWHGNQGVSIRSGNDNLSLYVNEPRLRWMTPWSILGAHYGAEIMLPWGYAKESGKVLWPTSPFPAFQYQLRPFSHSQFYVNDLEISPQLLAWQLKQFDISAGYAFWVPTQDNSFAASNGINLAPPQFHFWEHMLTLGGNVVSGCGEEMGGQRA